MTPKITSMDPDHSTGGRTFTTVDENGNERSWAMIPDFTNGSITIQMTDTDDTVLSATIDLSQQ